MRPERGGSPGNRPSPRRPLCAYLSAGLFASLLAGSLLLGAPPSARAEGEDAPAAPPQEKAAPVVDAEASRAAFEKAEVAREEERWKDAADLYWKAIEADHGSWLAHVRYQEAQVASGGTLQDMVADYDSFVTDIPSDPRLKIHRTRLEALAVRLPAFEAMLKAGPKNPDVQLEVGRAYLDTGDATKAVKPLTDALAALGTGRTDVVLLLAEAEFRNGKRAEARLRVDKTLAASPELFEGHLLLARFDLLESKWLEAARRGDLCLQMRPTWIAAALVKSEALVRQGEVEKGLAALDGLRAQGRETRDLQLALAELLTKAPKVEEASWTAAAAVYDKILAAAPGNGRALYGLAWNLERQGKFEDAEKRYREAVVALPTSAAAVNSVGYCLLKQGKITDAQAQFKKAIDLDATFVGALANLGASYDAQANYAEAIRTYERILRMKGQENNIRALVNLAFDHEALGSFPKAEEFLRKAKKIQPDDAQLATWLGDNLYFQEKWKDAAKAYQEAIAIDEKAFYAYRGYGYTLGREKKWADAVAALEKARALKPTDQDVLVALGDIYLVELNDLENALKSYEAYVQAGGTDPSIPELITEIRKELDK